MWYLQGCPPIKAQFVPEEFKDPLWDSPREPLLLKANCFKVLPMLKAAILKAEFGFEECIRTVIAREVLVSPDGGGMFDCQDFKSIVQLVF